MYTAQLPHIKSPFSIRYPRGKGVLVDWQKPFEEIEIGKGRQIIKGENIAILTIGHVGNYALEAIDALETKGIFPALYDMRFIKPIDEVLLHEVFSKFNKIIIVEDGALMGGFGSAVLEFMADHEYSATVKRLGIPDKVIEHGDPELLHKDCKYDAMGIYNTVLEILVEVYS